MRDDLRAPQSAHDGPSQQVESNACPKILHLRVLATTDIHMQFLGHDYIRDVQVSHNGLAGLATLVEEARAEAAADGVSCVLFDNGDLLQGSALGDLVSRQPVSPDHMVVRCLDAMGYDAIGVGNHDLDHGLHYAADIAAHSRTPLICSNLQFSGQSPMLQSALISRTSLNAADQSPVELRIGVLSVLPELTALWNRRALQDQAEVTSVRRAVTAMASRLRDQGADVVILLAHLGIEDGAHRRDDVRTLAAEPGIDAVIAGHTHRRLPGKDHQAFEDVDVMNGSIGGCPALMPGFEASDLGVLDLKLGQSDDGRWRVLDHATELRPNTRHVKPDPKITAICSKAHAQTRRDLAQPVGYASAPIHNFFSLAMPTATCAIVASAKRHIVQQELQGMAEAELPILAAASAHTAGGRGGPDHFLHIPTGPVLRRHLAGLNPYSNQICALLVTGADLRQWLEHACKVFTRLVSGDAEQELKQANKPAYDFDTIFGLDYAIDPTRDCGERITQLHYAGVAVTPDQPFVLATNLFRAAGGGGGAELFDRQIMFERATSISGAVQTVLTAQDGPYWQNTVPWRFSTSKPVQATLHTGPQAQYHLDDIAHLSPEPLGIDEDGFARIRLCL